MNRTRINKLTRKQLINETLKKRVSAYIRRIADKFTQENLLVAIKRVDDQAKKLVNLSLKCECFSVRHWRNVIEKERISQREFQRTKSATREKCRENESQRMKIIFFEVLGMNERERFYSVMNEVLKCFRIVLSF